MLPSAPDSVVIKPRSLALGDQYRRTGQADLHRLAWCEAAGIHARMIHLDRYVAGQPHADPAHRSKEGPVCDDAIAAWHCFDPQALWPHEDVDFAYATGWPFAMHGHYSTER